MFLRRSWRLRVAALAAASLLPASGAAAPYAASRSAASRPGSGTTSAAPAELPPAISAAAATRRLTGLTVAGPRPMTGYSRARFPHWSRHGHDCDTREVVLARDGADVKQDARCRALSGAWHSAYDGEDFDDPARLDIDHMVPLAQAWRSGADRWTDARRKEFANDLDGPQLIAVSAASNRSKGDQSPDRWRPPLPGYWCTYSRAWIDVKARYELTVTEPEREALSEMLATCQGPDEG
ncbi:HNH endonuclease family protein [Actinomadura sp. ATCC 31491]|uniref:HNH endonuclease family protein n=1 Tax=Actinomadura luzonensis TaxID=2805427 RepID=A0ABT0FLL4_9ACTN|nr:HNH endonuclease family protein [Actinomadura luzonensis]MCK2212833.1 HNH endonuclease family protein [Actinomadura luzonensis]